MDSLSITASAIAVATLAAQTCSAFAQLRTLCKTLPGRLHALNNEVTDIEVVCYQVAAVLDERACLKIVTLTGNEDPHDHIRRQLKQASDKLNELKRIIDRITLVSTEHTKAAIFAVHAWKKAQTRLEALQDDIKTVKCTLNILLGASHS
jgi:DNA-directed RNA polymerase subunit L